MDSHGSGLVEQLTHAPRHGVNARSLLLEQALAAEDDADDAAQLAKVDQLKQKAHLRKVYQGCEGLMRGVPVAERALVDYVARAKVTRAPRQLILDRLAGQHLALALFKEDTPATPEAVAARPELRRAALQLAKQQELEIFQQHRAAPAGAIIALKPVCRTAIQIYANAAAKASAADKVLQLEAAEAAAAEAARQDARQRHKRKAEAAMERQRQAKLAKAAAETVLLEAELEWDGDSGASPGSAQQQQPVPEVQPASAGTPAEQGPCSQAGEPHSGAGNHTQPTQSAPQSGEQPKCLQQEGGCADGRLQEEQECTAGGQCGARAAVATDPAEPSVGEAAGKPPAGSPAERRSTVIGARWHRKAITALVRPCSDQAPSASVATGTPGAMANIRQPRGQPATGEEPDGKELLQAVQGFVLGHLAPLEGAGLVSAEVKELVMQKATNKIVQTHKQANTLTFLLHEGQRIRGLIDKYVLWAQQKLKAS